MTKLLNAASRGRRGAAETTAKLTDLSDSDIVIDMFIVCRHVIMSKRAMMVLRSVKRAFVHTLTDSVSHTAAGCDRRRGRPMSTFFLLSGRRSSVLVIAIFPAHSCPVSILNTINLLRHAVYRHPWPLSFHLINHVYSVCIYIYIAKSCWLL